MTLEDKQLLLKDLSTRLPYGVMVVDISLPPTRIRTHKLMGVDLLNGEYIDAEDYYHNSYSTLNIRPYLRPLSSMTEEELNEFRIKFFEFDTVELMKKDNSNYAFIDLWLDEYPLYSIIDAIDWLNSHHFDYRGLIDKGLALEAPEGIYN